jgi:AraC family transcriptional regulator
MDTLIFRHQSFEFLFKECIDFMRDLGKKNMIAQLRTHRDNHQAYASPYAFKTSFSGRRFYEFERNRVATDSGNFLLLNDGQRFSGFVDSEEEVESLSVFFALQFILDVLNNYTQTDDKLLENHDYFPDKELNFFEKLYPLNPETASLVAKLKLSIEGTPEDLLKTEQYLHELVRQLLLEQQQLKKYIQQLPFAKRSTKIEIYKRLVRVKDYMDSCFSENISLAKLAGIACMSEHHFLRHFKLVFGKTPYQYLTIRRLEEAKVLLKRTNYSIVKVISMIGFECPSNFSRIFKLYTSYTPRGF